jgi:hypothetical protein
VHTQTASNLITEGLLPRFGKSDSKGPGAKVSRTKKCRKCGADRHGKVRTKCGHEEKRGGAGRGGGKKKKERPEQIDARTTEGQKRAAAIIVALNKPAREDDSYEIQKFRRIDDAGVRESLDLRKWIYDKRDCKAMQEIRLSNPPSKPFEIDVTSAREKLMAALSG